MTPDQAIGMILFAPAVLFAFVGGTVCWVVNKIKAELIAEAKAKAQKEYEDSLFFLDIDGDCKFYETN